MGRYQNYHSKAFEQQIKNDQSLASLKKCCGNLFDQQLLNEGINWFRSEYQQTVHQYPGDNIYYEELQRFVLAGESFFNSRTMAEIVLAHHLKVKQFYYINFGIR